MDYFAWGGFRKELCAFQQYGDHNTKVHINDQLHWRKSQEGLDL
jgi:hypothetical protein